LNSREKNIITLEDPVEYLFPMIRQSQINPKAGLTFASGLRAILRQDPNIILVGEIRDAETMEMAIRAALTGHLVFSTLHTNDAAGAIPRLLDMGMEPFLLASSLIAVLSQRLVRVICSQCKEPASVDQALLATVGWEGKEVSLYRGKGCPRCNQTGYRGRIGILEYLHVSPKIGKLIMERKDSKVIKEVATEEGMVSLREDGLQKVLQGITTLEEVLGVVG
ncbi:MAG: ATPase, T2SS/T4P/T4SS family, partial [Deltaproteobacteria bacterium]|nr:ATPase, T2SS/T4P/T4SS family [Deltaproteobacteria bacterium]